MKFVQGSRKGQRPRAYVEYRKDRRGSTDGFEMLLRCGFITYDTGLFTAMDIHLKNFPGLEDEWRGTEAHP